MPSASVAPSRGREVSRALDGNGRAVLVRLRRWFQQSPRVHLREQPVHDLRSCLGLLDRFLDGATRYPLEWDDFISWESDSPGIESVRDRFASLEPLFMSKDSRDRERARSVFLEERNKLAALVGAPARAELPSNPSLERP